MNQTKRKKKFILSKRKKKINKKTHRKNINNTRRIKTNYGGSGSKRKGSKRKGSKDLNTRSSKRLQKAEQKIKEALAEQKIKKAKQKIKKEEQKRLEKEKEQKIKEALAEQQRLKKAEQQRLANLNNLTIIPPGKKILDYNSSELFDLTVTTLNNKFGSHKIEASTEHGIKLPYSVFLYELNLYKDAKSDRKTEKRNIRKKFLELCNKYDEKHRVNENKGELNELFMNLSFILNGGDVKYNNNGIMKYGLYPDNKLITIATGGNIITIFAKIIKIIYGNNPDMKNIIDHINENDGVFNSFSDFDFALVPNTIKSATKTADTSAKKTDDTSAKKNSGFVLTRVKLSTEFDDTIYNRNKNNSNKPIKLKQYIKELKENETQKIKKISEKKKEVFNKQNYTYTTDDIKNSYNKLKKMHVDSIPSFSKYSQFCIECMKFYEGSQYFKSEELPHKSEFVQARVKPYNEFAGINNNIDFLHTYDFEDPLYGRQYCHKCKLLIDYLLAKQNQTADQTKNNVNTIVEHNIKKMNADKHFKNMVFILLGIQLPNDHDTKRLFSIIHYIHTQNKRMNTYITKHSINTDKDKSMNDIISYYTDLSTTHHFYDIMYDLCKDFIKHNTDFISILNQNYNIVSETSKLKTYENKRIKFKVSNIRNDINKCSNITTSITSLPKSTIKESNPYIKECFIDENNQIRDLTNIQNIEFTTSVIVLDDNNNVCELGFFDEDDKEQSSTSKLKLNPVNARGQSNQLKQVNGLPRAFTSGPRAPVTGQSLFPNSSSSSSSSSFLVPNSSYSSSSSYQLGNPLKK